MWNYDVLPRNSIDSSPKLIMTLVCFCWINTWRLWTWTNFSKTTESSTFHVKSHPIHSSAVPGKKKSSKLGSCFHEHHRAEQFMVRVSGRHANIWRNTTSTHLFWYITSFTNPFFLQHGNDTQVKPIKFQLWLLDFCTPSNSTRHFNHPPVDEMTKISPWLHTGLEPEASGGQIGGSHTLGVAGTLLVDASATVTIRIFIHILGSGILNVKPSFSTVTMRGARPNTYLSGCKQKRITHPGG